jgi:hypothetical protein
VRRMARLSSKASAAQRLMSEADKHDLTATSMCLEACRHNAARLEAARDSHNSLAGSKPLGDRLPLPRGERKIRFHSPTGWAVRQNDASSECCY